MQIILLERIEKLGSIGDVVTVKDGYARNFLLPRSKALRANAANLSALVPGLYIDLSRMRASLRRDCAR